MNRRYLRPDPNARLLRAIIDRDSVTFEQRVCRLPFDREERAGGTDRGAQHYDQDFSRKFHLDVTRSASRRRY